MDACSVHLLDLPVDVSIGNNLAVQNTSCVFHVETSVLGTFKQHLPTVKSDWTNFGVLTHKPSSGQCNPHQLALCVALTCSVLTETVCRHSGSIDPVVSDFLVPRAHPRLCKEIVKPKGLLLPIVRILGFEYSEVVGIWGQAILGFVRFDLTLRAMEEERTTRVFDVKSDTISLQVIDSFQQVVFTNPSVRSAKIRNNMNLQAATIAPVVRSLVSLLARNRLRSHMHNAIS